MKFALQAFQIQKSGSNPNECEDAFRWDLDRRVFAIADGATDAAFQRLWAKLLVDGFVQAPLNNKASLAAKKTWFTKWLNIQQQNWNNSIDWNSLPWHGTNKARQTGGLATFIGITFTPHSNHWQGIAVGDCNLFIFQRSSGRISISYPIQSSQEFGSQPYALSSIDRDCERQFKRLGWAGGYARPGDVMVLATDAVAQWCLLQYEQNEDILARLLTLNSNAAFEMMIESLRQNSEIKDDDSSLLVITIS